MATPNDRAILNAIINPLLPVGEFVDFETDQEPSNPENEDTEAIRTAKDLERKGVELAESGSINEALLQFNKAIEIAPEWASAYNNRAQAYRLVGKNEEAVNDLDKALQLSQGEGKVAAQSYCQRAMLSELTCKERAIKDWESAAKLGSQFAKTRLIQLNPYAALCNKMLHEVFSRLKEGLTD